MFSCSAIYVTDEGSLFVFGSNAFGQLGVGTSEVGSPSPRQVWKSVSAMT